MNLRKLFTRKRRPEAEAPLFNRWTLRQLVSRGIEPVDAGYPRPGDFVWTRYEGDTYLSAYHGSNDDGRKALVGMLYRTEDGFTSVPRIVPMSDIARTGYHRVDIRSAYYEDGRWHFVLAGDEDTRPMEVIR